MVLVTTAAPFRCSETMGTYWRLSFSGAQCHTYVARASATAGCGRRFHGRNALLPRRGDAAVAEDWLHFKTTPSTR